MGRQFSRISHAEKRARRCVIRFYSRHYFLVWALLPLSILSGLALWSNLICDPEQLNWLRKTLPQWVEKGSVREHFSEQSFLRLITSLKLAQSICFILIVASFALIFISFKVAWDRSHAQQRKGIYVVAVLIAVSGILLNESGNPCFDQWYFVYWYSPLEMLNPFSKITLNILIIVSNIAMALLLVATAAFHQDYSFLTDENERLLLIRADLSDIRKLLYFASAQFTISAYAIFFSLYVNTVIIQGQERQVLVELVGNLTFIYGSAYSLVLFTAFYPSFSKIKEHAYRLAYQYAPTLSPKEYFSKTGLDVTTPANVKDLLVVLGPIIASTSASVLQAK